MLLFRRRRWLGWSVAGLAVFLIVYGLAGFLAAPGWVRSALEDRLGALLDREVTVGTVRTNPFTLSVNVDDLLIADPAGEPIVSWDHLHLNVQASSILPGRIALREITLVNPRLRLRVRADGSVPLADVLNRIGGSAAEPAEPPTFHVGLIDVTGAMVSFSDHTRATPFESEIGPVRIHLEDFSSHRDSRNPYSFEGATADGATFAWSGYFHLDPIRSGGDFSVGSVPLDALGPYYEDRVNFDVVEGTFGARATYGLVWSAEERSFGLGDLEAGIQGLKIAARGDEEILVDVPSIRLEGGEVDVLESTAVIESIVTSNGSVLVRRDTGGTLNFQELLATSGSGAEDVAGGSVPRVRVHEITVSGYTVNVEDRVPDSPATLRLEEFSASIREVDSRETSPSDLNASFRLATGGFVEAKGTLSLAGPQGDLRFGFQEIDATSLDPWVSSIANLRVAAGTVDGNLLLNFSLDGAEPPALRLGGDARLGQFRLLDGDTNEPFVDWYSLAVPDFTFELGPGTLIVARIAVDEPHVRLARTPGGTRDPSAPDGGTTETTLLNLLIVETVRVENGRIDIEDRGFDPPLGLAVSDIDVTIDDVSSVPGSAATLQVRALLAEKTPLEVSGTVVPLGETLSADLTAKHTTLDLRPLGPLLERFLGHRLEDGRLDLDLACRIENDMLDGTAHVIFDPLELGEPVDSPDAVDAPVKLGLSLLRDRRGRIDLELPIEGDVSDPDFRIGGILGKAMGGAVRKVATSPFRALGKAFGGGDEDLSYVEFAPGGTELRDSAKEKIDVLAAAFYDRPTLALKVGGSTDEETDVAALKLLELDRRLREGKREAMAVTDRYPPPVEEITVTAEEHVLLIAQLFARAFPDKVTGEPVPARTPEGAPIPGVVVHPGLPSPIEMERRLIESLPVYPEDLRELADARAESVIDYLLGSGQVEPDRVVRAELGGRAARGEGSRVYFELQ